MPFIAFSIRREEQKAREKLAAKWKVGASTVQWLEAV